MNFIARTLIAVATTLAAVTPLHGQQSVEIRRAVTATASLRITGPFAELHIRGWSKDSVVITGTVPSDARFEGGFLSAVAGISPGGKFYLETASGTPAGKLEMHVPAGARVWAKSGSATIDVEGVIGGLDLNIIGGSVHVVGDPHELTVESMDGAVTVEGTPAWARLKTASGDVVLTGASEDAGLTTVSGAIRVGGQFERLRISSVTGGVDFNGAITRGGSLDVDTHSGAIGLRFGPKFVGDFDVATIAGTIENRLTKQTPIPGREGRGQEVGFTTGAAGARVYVRTFKGNVRIEPVSLKTF